MTYTTAVEYNIVISRLFNRYNKLREQMLLKLIFFNIEENKSLFWIKIYAQ